jgi:hypothetical protein
MRRRHLAAVIAGTIFAISARSDESRQNQNQKDLELAELTSKLLGKWIRNSGCAGDFDFRKDRTFHLEGYGPGGAEVKGTWRVKKAGDKTYLVLTPKDSGIEDVEPKPTEFELILIDRTELVLKYATHFDPLKYKRAKENE